MGMVQLNLAIVEEIEVEDEAEAEFESDEDFVAFADEYKDNRQVFIKGTHIPITDNVTKNTRHRQNNTTAEYKLKEIARLLVQGETISSIAAIMGHSSQWIRELVIQAKKAGYVDILGDGRDQHTKQMTDKLRKLSDEVLDLFQDRLTGIKSDVDDPEIEMNKALGPRAMTDAFKIFDTADVVLNRDMEKGTGNSKTVFNIFGNDAIQKARDTSNRIFDVGRVE